MVEAWNQDLASNRIHPSTQRHVVLGSASAMRPTSSTAIRAAIYGVGDGGDPKAPADALVESSDLSRSVADILVAT